MSGLELLLVVGGATAIFYFLFKKTAPTAAEVFKRQQERPSNVAGPKRYENAMSPEAMIPKNASVATYAARGDAPQTTNPTQASGAVPNPFRKNPEDPTIGDGLPPGFSGSFDDDPEAADIDGVEEEAPEPGEEM